jgi:hypothetical protein
MPKNEFLSIFFEDFIGIFCSWIFWVLSMVICQWVLSLSSLVLYELWNWQKSVTCGLPCEKRFNLCWSSLISSTPYGPVIDNIGLVLERKMWCNSCRLWALTKSELAWVHFCSDNVQPLDLLQQISWTPVYCDCSLFRA